MALVFLEESSLALSTLGWQVIYRQLAEDGGFYLERFFWDKSQGCVVPADSDKGLEMYPLIGFSLNFEGDFLKLLWSLQSGSIPVHAREREDWPLLMAGGPITSINPFPILPSLDFIYVGEAEQGFLEVACKIKQLWLSGAKKRAALENISSFPGIYVPGLNTKVTRQVYYPGQDQLPTPAHSAFVSNKTVFRDTFLVEINRGCPYGCRFCAAGFIYRPRRTAGKRELETLVQEISPKKVGLVGTALTDWQDLQPFLQWLRDQKIKFSLSSMRVDGLSRDFLEFLRTSGIRSITLAVEGISQRLRTAVNKHFSQDSFFSAVQEISRLQFNSLKLYFILGLPGEDEQDFKDLKLFLERMQEARVAGMGKRRKGIGVINISASMFVPKPWTPLQWAPMDTVTAYEEKARKIKKLCAPYKGVKFTREKPFTARIQGLLSRGDEHVHRLMLLAATNQGDWNQALSDWDGDVKSYLNHERREDEAFPWDRLDIGVEKDYLLREWYRYWNTVLTSPCPDVACGKCRRCGMGEFLETFPRW